MTRLSQGLIAVATAAVFVTLASMAGAQDKKSAAKPKSKCNAITEETACKADATCSWVGPAIRKTGKERKFPLIYQEVGGIYVIVASKGGAPENPGWYLNLQENPEVRVQVKADKFTARARTADDTERGQLWPAMTAVWPAYDDYQTKTDRQIPVVVLERT